MLNSLHLISSLYIPKIYTHSEYKFSYYFYFYSAFHVAPMFYDLEVKNYFPFQIGRVGNEIVSHAALLVRGGWLANLEG